MEDKFQVELGETATETDSTSVQLQVLTQSHSTNRLADAGTQCRTWQRLVYIFSLFPRVEYMHFGKTRVSSVCEVCVMN